jgi:hypothetical protein
MSDNTLFPDEIPHAVALFRVVVEISRPVSEDDVFLPEDSYLRKGKQLSSWRLSW